MQKNKVLQTKMKVLRKINVLFVNKNKELPKKKFCKKKISFANKNNELQNINETSNDLAIHFSMAISNNLFAMLLLFCVSVKILFSHICIYVALN